MGVRFNRSISLGHGVRLNFSRGGVGISVGRPGMRVGIHSSGRRSLSVGVPGTGIGYRASSGGKRGRAQPLSGLRPIRCALALLFGRRSTRAFVRGLCALLGHVAAADDRAEASPRAQHLCLPADPDSITRALPHFQRALDRAGIKAPASFHLFLGWCHATGAQPIDQAITHLRAAIAHPNPIPDRTLARYLNGAHLQVAVTSEVHLEVPVSTHGAALLLAELLQTKGDLPAAIATLEALPPVALRPAIALSLADLYCATQRWQDAITVTNETRNTDDLTAQAMILRARALSSTGAHAVALDALREALRSTKRSLPVLLAARYQRGLVYLALANPEKARADFQAVHAFDAGYADVAQRTAGSLVEAEHVDAIPTAEPDQPRAATHPGAHLRDAPRRAGLTQQELAARAKVSKATITRIEVGATIPYPETMARLLRACEPKPLS